jgi:signal transduction histidine kinase
VLRTRWKLAVLALGVGAAAAAFWITLDARFLADPGWLAVQKADLILGPISVGLYWRHRRPDNPFGLLLIGLGLLGVPYILESFSHPALFAIGLITEPAIYLMTSVVILAFPSGRLERRPERLTIAFIALVMATLLVVQVLASPHINPSFSISGCRNACPPNELAVWSRPGWMTQFLDAQAALLVAIPILTAALLVWRYVTGTPPRRRALAIGAPIALLFLLVQAAFRVFAIVARHHPALNGSLLDEVLRWMVAGTRSFVWYGFLFALIGAELYAGRVLRRLVGGSLGRPSFRELEGMLRGALGDLGLRLGFWRADTSEWVDADGTQLARARADQHCTEVERDGHAVIAIVHDQQLVDDPELLRAAGAVALLSLENAELDAAWKDSLRELSDSRARLTRASDQERRKLERDLHDGAQQRLLAALIRVSAAGELVTDTPELTRQLAAARFDLEAAIDELRDLARGLYPTILAQVGLAGALRSLTLRSPQPITIKATSRRFAAETEAALYYCCLEAVQNALKHAGPEVRVSIRLFITDDSEVRLEVRDTGPGFDPATAHDGIGLQSMRDRLGAVGGHFEVRSRLGCGAVVSASIPVDSAAQPDTRAG